MRIIKNMKISVIIPVYNEAGTIKNVITNLKKELAGLNLANYEIMAIDDVSTDNSLEILKKIADIKIIKHPYNKGNGAAVKTGLRHAKFDWILIFDADGQHKTEDIKQLLKYTENYDLISGERHGYQGPWIRQPGKKLIHWLARYLLGQKIKDFNCGFRLIRKDALLRFTNLLPNGFSWATTSLFAFYKEKLNVKFVPIEINKRQGGKSMVKPGDAVTYFMLILRLIMLFSPLRFFLPISFLLFLIALIILILDVFVIGAYHNITIGFLLFSSILIFFFGLLADQVAALRREIR